MLNGDDKEAAVGRSIFWCHVLIEGCNTPPIRNAERVGEVAKREQLGWEVYFGLNCKLSLLGPHQSEGCTLVGRDLLSSLSS